MPGYCFKKSADTHRAINGDGLFWQLEINPYPRNANRSRGVSQLLMVCMGNLEGVEGCDGDVYWCDTGGDHSISELLYLDVEIQCLCVLMMQIGIHSSRRGFERGSLIWARNYQFG